MIAEAPPTEPRVTLLGRAGCHLCTEAAAVVADEAARAGVGWVEVDVDADPELRAEYGDLVPVVLVDGTEHAHYRVDPHRLRAVLAALPKH